MNCSCDKYTDLSDRPSLNKRGHDTKRIIANLALLATDSSGEHKLYKCAVCGQFWQRSLDWSRGNNAYLFKVTYTDEVEWAKKPFVQPDDLFDRIATVQQYLERASFKETSEICRIENCLNKAVELSVLCAFHHIESIGIKSTMTDDYNWFGPYVKSNYEFGIEQLKKLPNYKVLST